MTDQPVQQQQQQQQQQQPVFQLTSTTAPGVVFANRNELAEHYKSDWHKYNLKRREANLPMLVQHDFLARLHAAQAVRDAKQQQQDQHGTDHLKQQKKKNKNKNNNNNNKTTTTTTEKMKKEQEEQQQTTELTAKQQQQQQPSSSSFAVITTANDDDVIMEEEVSVKRQQQQQQPVGEEDEEVVDNPNQKKVTFHNDMDEEDGMMMTNDITIDPCQSLFDRKVCKSVQANVQYMYKKYGFFVPDKEYLTDMEGFIGYCHEKIQIGYTCLYCQKIFMNHLACIQHMIDTSHTKILYENGYDLDELSIFYDFTDANNDFLSSTTTTKQKQKQEGDEDHNKHITNNTNDDEEWEDASDDGNEEMADIDNNNNEDNEDEEDMYDEYQKGIASMGWDITPLGELIFPDGRIIGHRALKKYYQQKIRPDRYSNNNNHPNNTAVMAAKNAARERLFRGHVYTIGDNNNNGTGNITTSSSNNNNNNNALITKKNNALLCQMGIAPNLASGRASKGILNTPVYTQLSVYRFRAAIRKQRRGDVQGQRLYNKQYNNLNHMNKRHNNLMTGVSVAHALR